MIKSILSLLLLSLCSTCIFSCNNIVVKQEVEKPNNQFPQKHEMIVLSDRPPQLETPLPILRQDITPNADFFVRWHLSQIINKIDIDTFRLYVGGEVQKPLALSMTDLKTSFPIDSLIAVAVCAGNGRSFFNPQVPGLQWKNGGIGNAKWKGVKLSTILKKAGISNKAVDITFQGMDVSPMPGIPPYVRSISSEHAMAGEVLVAFEMNGEELPILNGYPLKLVVPGWYASYWIGSLNHIEVLNKKYEGFWMKKSYLVPDNANYNEHTDSLASTTKPATTINLRSFFVRPDDNDIIEKNKPFEVEGLVYNDGTPVEKVEISTDGGITWELTNLQPEIGKYSWRRWKYNWTPKEKGKAVLMIKATDKNGHTQPKKQWNKNGYASGFIVEQQINIR